MRVLFATMPHPTHLHFQVPLAWALQTAGHEVRIASQPDLTPAIVGAGLTAVPIGEPLEMKPVLVDDAPFDSSALAVGVDDLREENLTYDYLQRGITTSVGLFFSVFSPPSVMDEMVDFARAWRPDLVIWDPITYSGPVAAKACRAAHARLLFGPDVQGRVQTAYLDALRAIPPELRDDPMEDWLGSTLERHGCEYDPELTVGQSTLTPLPASMSLPVDLPQIPFRFVPYGGNAVVPHWMRGTPERPRVCITLGLTERDKVINSYVSPADLVDAVADLDIEVVATFTAEQVESLKSVPDNVRVVEFVPLHALLPTCSAIVHHGGSGTFTSALLHGVPQMVIPTGLWDTEYKADRIQSHGTGVRLPESDIRDAGDITGHLMRLLDEPGFATAAAGVRTEMLDLPSPNDIVPTLEELACRTR